MKNKEKNIITVENKIDWPISWWLVLVLLLLNAILAWPMVQDGYTRFMESIEGAHLVNARWLMENGGTWNDQWYFGFPTHLTYPPLIPNLMAWLAVNFNLTITHAYRLLIGFMIWLIPLGIYIFAQQLTKRKTVAVLAGLMFMIMPNIAYFVIPEVQSTPASAGWIPYHWVVLAQYGEGPHLAGIFFMLIGATFFLKSLDNRSKFNLIGTAVFLALTMLTNLFAGMAMIFVLLILQLGRMFIYVFDTNWRRLALAGLLAYGLTAFAFDYYFIRSILQSGYIHPENTVSWPPFLVVFFVLLFLVIPVTLLIYHMVVGRDKYYPVVTMTIWTVFFLGVAAVYYYFGYNLITQPNRYLHEAQIGTVILVAMGMAYLIDNARRTYHPEERFTKNLLVTVGIFTFIFAPSFNYLKNPHWAIRPYDITQSTEWEIANWLDEHIEQASGERVYLTGTPSFWFNVFSDLPQIRGGADNAQPNSWWADAAYTINKSDNEELTRAWLNLLNVKYVLVNYPESGTHYVDYEYPERFDNWPRAGQFAEGGFRLFQVPDSNLSLFSIVKTSQLASIDFEKNDPDSVINLANLINRSDNSRIKYEKNNSDEYNLAINDLQADETVIFKMNFDECWRARGMGDLTIDPIGPNFMAVTPRVDGPIEINWGANPTKWEITGQIISVLTLAGLIYWLSRKEK